MDNGVKHTRMYEEYICRARKYAFGDMSNPKIEPVQNSKTNRNEINECNLF